MKDCGKQQAIDDEIDGRKLYGLQRVSVAFVISFNNVRPTQKKKAKYANI